MQRLADYREVLSSAEEDQALKFAEAASAVIEAAGSAHESSTEFPTATTQFIRSVTDAAMEALKASELWKTEPEMFQKAMQKTAMKALHDQPSFQSWLTELSSN